MSYSTSYRQRSVPFMLYRSTIEPDRFAEFDEYAVFSLGSLMSVGPAEPVQIIRIDNVALVSGYNDVHLAALDNKGFFTR